jgi:hypothetical protein
MAREDKGLTDKEGKASVAKVGKVGKVSVGREAKEARGIKVDSMAVSMDKVVLTEGTIPTQTSSQ